MRGDEVQEPKPIVAKDRAAGSGRGIDGGTPLAMSAAVLVAATLVFVAIGAQAWGRWSEWRGRAAADADAASNRELASPLFHDAETTNAIQLLTSRQGRVQWPTSQPESISTGPVAAVAGLNKARVQAGSTVFQRFSCATCHTLDGKPGVGPSLMNVVGSHVTLATGTVVVADADYIRESIRQPTAKVHKNFTPVMPDFGAQIKDREIDGLIEFLKSVSPDPANRIDTPPLQPPPAKP